MKLNLSQLEQHLTKKLLPSYIICGEEYFLKQEALNLIRTAAKAANFAETLRYTAESAAKPDALFNLFHSNSLLEEKKLIELDFSLHLPNKGLQTILLDYAANPMAANVIIIELGKLDAKTAKLPWFQKFDQIGGLISVWPISAKEMPQWIFQYAKKFKLQLSIEIAAQLASYVEGNLLAAAQAIEKLSLLQAKVIDKTILHQVMSDESHFSIFVFVEHMLAGEPEQALHCLSQLKKEGTEPVLILWAALRELRLALELMRQLEQGEEMGYLFKKYRIFFNRQHSLQRFLKRFNRNDCWQQLKRAHYIDKMIKGAAPGNVWQAMQIWCLSLV